MPRPDGSPTILEYNALLQQELGIAEPWHGPPVFYWVEYLLCVAVQRGARTVHLVPENGRGRVLLDDDELPSTSWHPSAASRLFIVAGLEKGEEARSRPQRGSQRVVLLHRFLVELHAETVPICTWWEELHIRIYPIGRVDEADPERIWIKGD
jgi:hypothetical protein